MEHITVKAGSAFYEAGGAPTLFAVGCFNGEVHLLRFGEGDGVYDAKREADRLRRGWGKQKRLEPNSGD